MRAGQDKEEKTPKSVEAPRQMRQPRLVLGGLYLGDDLVWNLEISPGTLSKWKRDGLKPFQSKADYYLADDVLIFWRNRKEG